jgi:multidrug efflux pump subunit AcrA (membrane-fusion protein)
MAPEVPATPKNGPRLRLGIDITQGGRERMCWKSRVATALLCLAFLMTGCRNTDVVPAATIPVPTSGPNSLTYVVQRGRVVKGLEFNGRISPVEEASLYFKTPGYVKQVYVKQGDRVKAGDLLTELETDDLLNQIAQTEVMLSSAQLRLDEAEKILERQIVSAELALQVAQVRLEEAKKANEQQTAAAQQALKVAQVRLEEAKKANERQIAGMQLVLEAAQIDLARLQEEQLDPVGSKVLRLDLDQAKNNLWNAQLERDAVRGRSGTPGYIRQQVDISVKNAEIAVREAELLYQEALQQEALQSAVSQYDIRLQQIEVEQANLALEQLQEGVDPLLGIEVERAQQELDWLQEGLDPVLVNEVSQAQLALERLQSQLAVTKIVAPMDGEILSLSVRPDRPVEALRTVVVIADPSAIQVSADLTTDELVDLTEGQKATIALKTDPHRTWPGAVRCLPYPYGTCGSTDSLMGTDWLVRVSLEGDVSDLELGTLVSVSITLEAKDDVLWLPPAALRSLQNRKFVIVQDGGRQRRVDVELGIEGSDRVEILQGLEEGWVIIAP